MLKLYGYPVSNYYNIAKLCLLEKGVEFEEVDVSAQEKDAEYFKKSPVGKMPFLETESGFITETDVIIDYIDDVCDGPSFFPADPYEKAKVRELMKHMELYIELPARRLYPEAFMGGKVEDKEKEEVKPLLEKGFASIKTLANFDPYFAGKELTYADFYSVFSLGLATRVTKGIYNWNAMAELPGLGELLKELGERETVKKVNADMITALTPKK